MPRRGSSFIETPKPQVTHKEQEAIIRSGQIFKASKEQAVKAMESGSRQTPARKRIIRDYAADDHAVKPDRNTMDAGKIRAIRAKIKRTGITEPKHDPQPIDFAEKPDKNIPEAVRVGKLSNRWRRLKAKLTGFFRGHTENFEEHSE